MNDIKEIVKQARLIVKNSKSPGYSFKVNTIEENNKLHSYIEIIYPTSNGDNNHDKEDLSSDSSLFIDSMNINGISGYDGDASASVNDSTYDTLENSIFSDIGNSVTSVSDQPESFEIINEGFNKSQNSSFSQLQSSFAPECPDESGVNNPNLRSMTNSSFNHQIEPQICTSENTVVSDSNNSVTSVSVENTVFSDPNNSVTSVSVQPESFEIINEGFNKSQNSYFSQLQSSFALECLDESGVNNPNLRSMTNSSFNHQIEPQTCTSENTVFSDPNNSVTSVSVQPGSLEIINEGFNMSQNSSFSELQSSCAPECPDESGVNNPNLRPVTNSSFFNHQIESETCTSSGVSSNSLQMNLQNTNKFKNILRASRDAGGSGVRGRINANLSFASVTIDDMSLDNRHSDLNNTRNDNARWGGKNNSDESQQSQVYGSDSIENSFPGSHNCSSGDYENDYYESEVYEVDTDRRGYLGNVTHRISDWSAKIMELSQTAEPATEGSQHCASKNSAQLSTTTSGISSSNTISPNYSQPSRKSSVDTSKNSSNQLLLDLSDCSVTDLYGNKTARQQQKLSRRQTFHTFQTPPCNWRGTQLVKPAQREKRTFSSPTQDLIQENGVSIAHLEASWSTRELITDGDINSFIRTPDNSVFVDLTNSPDRSKDSQQHDKTNCFACSLN